MHDRDKLAALIEAAFEERATLTPQQHPRELELALDTCLELLDGGQALLGKLMFGETADEG